MTMKSGRTRTKPEYHQFEYLIQVLFYPDPVADRVASFSIFTNNPFAKLISRRPALNPSKSIRQNGKLLYLSFS